ncbi:MAG: hypothetical protein F6J97_13955 [Leptolyngbya sp. SIO4C1]|nr:hypothetical protein [Leptolyngbya sp. SIO4C1]
MRNLKLWSWLGGLSGLLLFQLPLQAIDEHRVLSDSLSIANQSAVSAAAETPPQPVSAASPSVATATPQTNTDEAIAQRDPAEEDSAEEDSAEEDSAEEDSAEEDSAEEDSADSQSGSTVVDDELGILRLEAQDLQIDDELGLIRIREIEDLPVEQLPPPPVPTTGFVTGRASFLGGTNLFRLNNPLDEQVFQVGTGFYLVPKLAPDTDLVLGVEGNLVRYSQFPSVDYNEVQIQAGIRQRLNKRTYGQLTWRNQNLYQPDDDNFFSADYVELLLSRRDILTSNLWLDSYYQARVSFSHPERFSRFSQIAIASLNYGFTPQFRTSLIYQLFLDDYTQVARYDTYHQVIGQITYDVTPTSRLNLFGGVKFGRSSDEDVNFDDIVYGASFNFNVPVF